MKSCIFCLILLILITSCGEENEPTVEGRKEAASYYIKIEGSEGGPHTLVGENVDSKWKSDIGYIYLGTGEKPPIGTITLNILKAEGDRVNIISATVSKTDVIEGTSAQANARLFELRNIGETAAGWIDSVEIGANYISGKLELHMERVTVFPDDAEEIVTVKGKFVAIH